MHRYYAHALQQVLAHQPHFAAYAVRHPFPPYATQYISLLALFHFFSFDLAERVFTCVEILCFACGLRFCATAIGPAGEWVSLLMVPLLLPWYLLMGFFNYSIGIGIALFSVAFWLRLDRGRAALLGFAVSTLVLIFSHPVPLLLLLAFMVADLLRRRFFVPAAPGGWLRRNVRHLLALLYALLLALYPSLAIDKSQTASTLNDMGFHLPFVRTALLLTGLSPYNTRSHGLLVNGYRSAAYLLLVVTALWAMQAVRRSLQARELTVAGAFFVYAAVFAMALPFLPDRLNGGVFFATRMVITIWIFMLLAAAGLPEQTLRFRRTCIALGAVFTVLTLLPAEHIDRPLAHSLRQIEQQALPRHTSAIVLDGPLLTVFQRKANDLAYNPFLWANVLPLIRQDDLVLNAPWLDLSISPLRGTPGTPMLNDATHLIDMPASDPPPRLTSLLPAERVEKLIRDSDIVMYAGVDSELNSGLVEYLGADDAAQFSCRRPLSWSLECVRRPRQ